MGSKLYCIRHKETGEWIGIKRGNKEIIFIQKDSCCGHIFAQFGEHECAELFVDWEYDAIDVSEDVRLAGRNNQLEIVELREVE